MLISHILAVIESNYHHLRLFQATARVGHVGRAAEALRISQPAVSKQIAELERALGVALFDRLGRRLRLTPAGEIALTYADQIFALTDDLHQALGDLKGLRRGKLVLGASTTVGEYLLPRIMGRFRQAHPGVELVLEIANTEQILERVLRRAYDLGFIGTTLEHEAIAVEPFVSDEVVVICGPREPLGKRTSVPPIVLEGQPFIVREAGSATRSTGEAEAARLGIRLRIVMALGSNDAVKEAVSAGLGLGLLSRHAIQSELHARELRVVPVRGWAGRRQLSIIYARGRRLHGLAQAFLDFVRPARQAARPSPVRVASPG